MVGGRLVLFDLDGTLLRSEGLGRMALDAVFRNRYGWSNATRDVDFAGAIDPEIVAQVFVQHGQDAARARAEERGFFADYVAELRRLVRAGARPCRALPGVPALLARLRHESVVPGLLTGNVEGGALAKLDAAGLERFHEVGAFGDEARTREALLPLALRRANARRGRRRPFVAADAVVVGDTPRDVAVARAHGARAIAVATGFASREALEAAGPDALLDDLGCVERSVEALLS